MSHPKFAPIADCLDAVKKSAATILAIESGGEIFSAALRIGTETRSLTSANAPHSEKALPLIQKLLDEAGVSLSRCDAFAFGAGPGKFSGLRLACGIAQSFAFAMSRPGIAADSLAALAAANFADNAAHAEAAIPAHRGFVYAAHCRRDSRWRSPRPRLLSAADYAPAARTRLVCGAGFLQYPEMLQNARAELSQIAPVPNAAAVAEIAATMLIEGETLPPEKCTPRYIRRKIAQTIAERMRER